MANRTNNLVETTNDLSIVSKASIVERGYVDDVYVKYFVPKVKRRSPLINRGYYLRFKALNYALSEHSIDLIVTLGAGFDTLPFRSNVFNGKLIEIDFIDVAVNKANVIANNSLLSPINFINLNCEEKQIARVVLQTDRYCLIGADLRDSKSICELLNNVEITFGHQKFENVAILNECSLCYIEEQYSNQLLKELLSKFVNFEVTFLSYEMMSSDQSNDAFTDVMSSHFESIGSPLKTLLGKCETIERMKRIGFPTVKVIDMLTFWRDYISNEEKARINKLEPFDEHEEFDLLCCNYALTIAKKQRNSGDCLKSNSSNEQCSSLECSKSSEIVTNTDSPVKYELSPKYLRRFGHCLSLTANEDLLIFGGFGYDETSECKHKRLSDLIRFNLTTNTFEKCKLHSELESRMHSQLVYWNEELLLLIGGRSSPLNGYGCTLLRKNDESNFVGDTTNDSNLPHCFRHRVMCLNNSSVISIGGKNSAKDTYYIYDVSNNKWKSENCPDVNRYSHSCASLDSNTIAITGGLRVDEADSFVDTSCLLDLRSNNCSILRNVPKIYSHTSHIDSNSSKLYICGGISSSGSSNQVLVYDLRNHCSIGSIQMDREHRCMLHNHCSVLLNNKLYTIGGGGNCFSFGTHINAYTLKIDLR